MQVSAAEKAAVNAIWSVASADAQGVGVKFYAFLFKTHPETQALFPSVKDKTVAAALEDATLKQTAAGIIANVDAAIKNCDNESAVCDSLVALGKRHKNYNVTGAHIDVFKPCFVAFLKENFPDKMNADATKGFTTIVTYVVDKLKAGLAA